MNYKSAGRARIDGLHTPIRKQQDGMYVVEAQGKVVYSSITLEGIEQKMDDDKIDYTITARN